MFGSVVKGWVEGRSHPNSAAASIPSSLLKFFFWSLSYWFAQIRQNILPVLQNKGMHHCVFLCGVIKCCWCFLFCFPAAAAESSLRLLSSVAQEVKGRGTISWIDCGYVTHWFSLSASPPPHLLFNADLAFLVPVKLFACNWTHIILCNFFKGAGSWHLSLLSSFWLLMGNNFSLVAVATRLFFSLKLETPASITFHGGHIAWQLWLPWRSHKLRKEESHVLCVSWRALQFCSDSRCCISCRAVCLVWKHTPIYVSQWMCFAYKFVLISVHCNF